MIVSGGQEVDVRVSVVMPFQNQERFIGESIESVLAQRYGSWELLLIDDGSTDGSTEIARQYAERHSEKIRYFEHEGHSNRGASAARNLGLRKARGTYIAFLDADDVWLPRKLEEQLMIMREHPEVGMLYGATEWWYSWTGYAEDAQRDYLPELGVQPDTLVMPPMLLASFLQDKAAVPCTCSVLVRRETIDQTGGFEESIRRVYTDQAFYAKICLKVPVFISGECWDRYRQHPDSCCSVAEKTGQVRPASIFYLNWLEGYLHAQGVKDSGLLKAVRKKRWSYRHPVISSILKRARYRLQLVNSRHSLSVNSP